MKKLLFFLFILSINVTAQTDSLTLKLKKLKTLKDSSLITQSEYDQLRLKELNLKPKIEKKIVQNTESEKRLKKNVQGKIVGASLGAILCGVGISRVIYYNNKPISIKYDSKGIIDQKDYDHQVSEKKRLSKAFSIFSGVMGVFAIANVVTLQNAINRFNEAKQSASVYFNPNGITFAYLF